MPAARNLIAILAHAVLLTGIATGQVRPSATARQPFLQTARMPNLLGRTVEYATQLLGRYGMTIGTVERLVSDSTPGTIIKQSLEPGSPVKRGLAINVAVASPRDSDRIRTKLPAATGLTQLVVPESTSRVAPSGGTADSVSAPAPSGPAGKAAPPAEVFLPKTPVGVTDVYKPLPDSSRVRVPQIEGMPLDAARNAVSSVGLSLVARDSVGDRRGRVVLDQRPRAGNLVSRGTEVRVRYGYQPPIQVPDLRQLTVDAASRALEPEGLRLGNVGSAPTDGDTGRVIDQDPRAGTTVDSGTMVSITIGTLRLVTVPRVVGTTRAEAETLLQNAGLKVGPVTTAEADGQPGLVLAQSPPAGSQVRPDSAVSLSISMSRRKIPVPNAVGLPPDSADTLITGAGQATLPPPRVKVPDLKGSGVASARSLLEDHQLSLGTVTPIPGNAGDSSITTQDPAAEAQVLPGTAVAVRIAVPRVRHDPPAPPKPTPTPVIPIRVPNVTGFEAGAAESTLSRLGIASNPIDTAAGLADHGGVLRQSPTAGAIVTPGLRVDLYVGVWPMSWLIGLATFGALGVGVAVTEPVTRWTRTRRWLKRVTYQYVSVAGKHTLSEPPESLTRADLQLQPRTARWTHVLALKGPLFPDDPT